MSLFFGILIAQVVGWSMLFPILRSLLKGL